MPQRFLIIALISSFLLTTEALAQEIPPSSTEEEQIKAVILGYIQNFFDNKYSDMEVFLHDRISKRGLNEDGSLSPEYPKEKLKELISEKKPLPLKYQKHEFREIKVYNNVATAILNTGYPSVRWDEHIHLIKVEGTWTIINVLWTFEI